MAYTDRGISAPRNVAMTLTQARGMGVPTYFGRFVLGGGVGGLAQRSRPQRVGQAAKNSSGSFMQGQTGQPPPDLTPPVVTLVSPAPGAISPSTPLVLDVTGANLVVLLVRFPDGSSECAWDGAAFTGGYAAAGSASAPITGGTRFTIQRRYGWTSAPTVEVLAIDNAGNIAV